MILLLFACARSNSLCLNWLESVPIYIYLFLSIYLSEYIQLNGCFDGKVDWWTHLVVDWLLAIPMGALGTGECSGSAVVAGTLVAGTDACFLAAVHVCAR